MAISNNYLNRVNQSPILNLDFGSQGMPDPDENGWVPTLNNRGYMSLNFDPYTESFLRFCIENPRATVFEGGAAFGRATLAALKQGVKVVANDMEKKHLNILSDLTPKFLKPFLSLAPGSLPHDVDFPSESFDAILCSRMIHFLTGNEIETCLKKFYNWLKRGGKLFLIAETPYLRCYSAFIPTYEKNKKMGVKWPGVIHDTTLFKDIRYNNIPSFLHFLDTDTLRTASLQTGFLVEKTEMINRTDFPPELRLDGRESVGIIAVKPIKSVKP